MNLRLCDAYRIIIPAGTCGDLSHPICDTILKRLEGPTKDRTAYSHAFARWISLHQHYIIDGDTYIRHTMPHEYINTTYIRSTSDYGWNTNRNSNDIHPASPGCRRGTYPLIEEEAEEELQNKQTSLSRHDHRITCTCNEDSTIPLPWVSRLAKLKGKGRGKVVRLQQRLSKVWWLTYEYKSEKRSWTSGRQLVRIKKWS